MVLEITAYDIAQRFVGLKEVEGPMHNPQIMAMLQLDAKWADSDEVAWCSGLVNWVAWLLRLPRSKSLRARSWLTVGTPVALSQAEVGFDVVILKRGPEPQPGPEQIEAVGHVGFYAGVEGRDVLILGGNQANSVNISRYNVSQVLGVRRLYA